MFRPFRVVFCLLPILACNICWSSERQPAVNRNCAQCHGADGNGRDDKGNWLIGPSIAGQIPEYITEQLRNFARITDKSNKPVLDAKGNYTYKRYAIYMSPLANVLDDGSMVNFGNMYSGYKTKITPIKADPTLLKRGEKIWREGIYEAHIPACAACHGVVGQGMPKLFPRLGGQQAQYLDKQLKKFRDGKRPGGPSDMMKTIASRLTEEDMMAVSVYASGLDFNPESDFITDKR